MKRLALLALLAAGGAAVQAQEFVDQARVRNVEPQYESVQVPRNECTSQWVHETRTVEAPRNYTGAVIGGVAGGILGHQVGKGSGRDAATAVGAVVGVMAGDHLANQNRVAQVEQVPREVRNCRTVSDVQTRINGYRVTYEYRGHMYTTVMPEDPGRTLPVRVSVVPAEREYHRRH